MKKFIIGLMLLVAVQPYAATVALNSISSLQSQINNVNPGDRIIQAEAETYQEDGGLVVIDMESTPAVTGWAEESSISGYLGTGYYRATINSFNSPGNGVLDYWFTVANGGAYQLQWRSRISSGTSSTDFNDNFVRLVDASGNPVVPIENDLEPTGSAYWHKVYMNTRNKWYWQASNHDNNPKALAWNLQAGQTYRLQVSYRSMHHAIDRLLLWNRDGGFGHDFGDMTGRPHNSALADNLPLSSPVSGTTGIDDLGTDTGAVYPNPAEDVLNIASSEVTKIEIFNVSGELVKSVQLNGSPVNVSELAKGVYMVKLIGSTTAVSKLVKK